MFKLTELRREDKKLVILAGKVILNNGACTINYNPFIIPQRTDRTEDRNIDRAKFPQTRVFKIELKAFPSDLTPYSLSKFLIYIFYFNQSKEVFLQ